MMSHLQLKFWGVRGSTPTPRSDRLAFGGNTPCIEFRVTGEDAVLVIDGGTGIIGLGDSLKQEVGDRPLSVYVLLTHFHWDHIQGLPFFAPLYDSKNRFHFHSERPAATIEEILEGQMSRPYFPVPFERVAAQREFVDTRDQEIRVGDLRIRSFPINHPQGACGYRLEANGAVVVHVSDHEHGDARIDAGIREQAQGADVLIYDAQYTPEEYAVKRGWGHSTYTEATRVARACGVRQLVLFHHDPGHDDESLRAIVAAARQDFENTEAAQEGSTIRL
jgi:phosphoribosyl 1,2-cyclic phosphodiesterase